MKAVFVELPAFARYRAAYLDDVGFRELQVELMKGPTVYDKNEADDLSVEQRKTLRSFLKAELEARSKA